MANTEVKEQVRSPIKEPDTQSEDLFDLTGKVALITGGAGMLGQQHAEVLARHGATPILVDTTSTALKEAAERLKAETGRPIGWVKVDITNRSQVQKMVETALKQFDKVDILINNAAMTVKGGADNAEAYFAPFEEYPVELWEAALQVNLTGAFLCSQAVGRAMVEAGKGVILNIASTVGVVGPDHRIYEGITNPYTKKPFNTPIAYSATKAGLIGMTRYLATYWASKGIRVNALSPGGVYDGHEEQFVKNYSNRVPMGRMAERNEYQGAVLFLVSEASSYVTGANLIVDGGLTAW